MRSEAWIALIRTIPQEMHGKLVLIFTSGNEINIQLIYRTEDDFLVARGRLAGTMEDGSVIIVPFDQINYLGFRENMKEAAVNEMFANYVSPPQAERAVTVAVAPPADSAVRNPILTPSVQPAPAKPAATGPITPAPVAPALAPNPTSLQPVLPGKAALLERLRKSRLGGQDSGSKGSGSK